MSEKIKLTPEAGESARNNGEHHERATRHHEAKAENTAHEHQENLEQILSKIEETAKTAQEAAHHQQAAETAKKPNPRFVGKELKGNNLKSSLRRVRKDLKPYQRPFSRLIHNRAVEKASEVGAKTIARPDGLLVGGVVSLLMSLGVLFVCRYYGYEYNYLIGLLSFPAGFILGIVGESLLKPLKRR
jgi:hypothetical protein